MSELVSVCIPTYNQATYIAETIESVLAQTYSRFELIIVDNASTDNTTEVVNRFPDPHLRFFRNGSNIGMVRNWNRCLELAQGEYVTILSSDDKYCPTFLEESVRLAEMHPEVRFVCTGSYFIDADGHLLGISANPGPHLQDGNTLFCEYWTRRRVRTPVFFLSTLYRRQALLALGSFTTQLKGAADVWAWLLLAVDGVVGYVPEPLTYYRMHTASVMGQMLVNCEVLDDRLRLAELVFSHPLVRRIPELLACKQHVSASAVYFSVMNLRAARRNGLSMRETWRFYYRHLLPLHWRTAIAPWTLYYLLRALLPPSLLAVARNLKLRWRNVGTS